ncbi:MAG: hypothetical protein AAGB14_13795, partial [Verrucomicrobiota bacterium]
MLSRPSPFASFVRILLLSVVLVHSAQAVLIYRLFNHPDQDGSADYGLRLNNLGRDLSGGDGGFETIWEFDFDDPRADGMFLTFDEALGEVRIFGSAYGGRVIGGAYSTDPDEVGKWTFDFLYTSNVQSLNPTDAAMLEVWVTPKDGDANSGTLQLEGSSEVIPFYEDPSASNGNVTFEFRPDGHRLGPGQTTLPGDDTFVGRGWLSYEINDQLQSLGTQDWIFTAEVVPEPSSALLVGL